MSFREARAVNAATVTYLRGVTDTQTTQIVARWAQAWAAVAPELEAATAELTAQATRGRVSGAAVARHARLQAAVDALAATVRQAAVDAGTTITADLDRVLDHTARSTRAQIGAQLPATVRAGLAQASPAQITAVLTRATGQIESLTRPLGDLVREAVKDALVRGVVVGDNPRRAAARMVAAVRQPVDLSLARALTIARTETLDAHRAAQQATEAANADVLGGWVWLTRLDKRTCRACLAMNGREFPTTEPGPQGHQNCRCARMPKTRSWAELGFPGVKEPPSLVPDADRWFRALPEGDQRRILGRAGYEQWAAGDYPVSSWAVRRDNPGWRPSYVTAQPGQVKAPTPPAVDGLTAEQYEALTPTSSWTVEKRTEILNALRTTDRGKILADTLDRFQDGGSIARLRGVIEKWLTGQAVDKTGAARAEALVTALRGAPPQWAPDVLYRGMSVPGTLDNVLAKYAPGQALDLNLTSFSSDRAIAKKFQMMTQKKGTTKVMVELVGDGKKVLPIQNMARDRRLFKEREWVSGGRYRVVEAKKSPSGGLLVRIEQVGTL